MAPMKRPANAAPSSELSNSLSLPDLARHWKLSRREVRQLLQQGKLPFEQICGKIRVTRSAVSAFENKTKSHV